ncbi:MAG: DeoR/GlpR family DNA-binding transcription regulator [Paracoccus sp. (in: a-proteobacteria)]
MSQQDDLSRRITSDRSDLPRALGQIADYLLTHPQEFISRPMRNLCRQIGVSEPTLIRFARHYGYQGLPDLRIALAMSLSAGGGAGPAAEPRLADKEVVNRAAKRAIAECALTLLGDDRAILLDSGSTLRIFAQLLSRAPAMTIMATGLNTIHALEAAEQHCLMMPGGTLRRGSMSFAGRLAEETLAAMRFDTVYIGADNVDPSSGLSTFAEEEAHLNRAMIRAARRVVVLADASKFRAAALYPICDLAAVDILICDSALPDDTAKAIRAAGTKLMLAAPSPQLQGQSR